MRTKHLALAGSFLVWGPWGLAEMPVKPCTSRQGLGSTQPSGLYWGRGISWRRKTEAMGQMTLEREDPSRPGGLKPWAESHRESCPPKYTGLEKPLSPGSLSFLSM